MKVITLHTDAFEQKCRELAHHISVSGHDYDFIVGIATGGDYVGKIVASELSSAGTHYITVVARRPSTHLKTGLVEWVLQLMPTCMNNLLRVIEAKMLSAKKKMNHIDVEIGDTDRQSIEAAASPRILIVDDAVDSGNTMQRVVDELLSINKQAKITTAAITQTTSNPDFTVDFALYKNNTLIRFPWSKDMKKKL